MSLIRRAGRVAVASSIHGNVQRRQHQKWSAQDQAAAQAAAVAQAPPAPAPLTPAPVAPPVNPTLDPVDEVSQRIALLTQLGELRAAGVLSDEEFAQQKARVLG